MSFFEFPHTRTYDSDLGWLIKSMKELLDEYNALMAWKNQHDIDYRALALRVTALENNIATFEAEIERRFAALETDFDNRFNTLEVQLTNKINFMLAEAIAEIQRQIGDMRQQISNLSSELTRQRIYLEGRIKATGDYSIQYTDDKIQALINSLPEIMTVVVFNPVRGEVTSIQEAINDIYDLGRVEGLTALEYDSLQLTAAEYDALELTAFEYDRYAKTLLEEAGYIKNPYHYMISPFTGDVVPLQTVITELATLHKVYALTADEYDLKELTASDYDALELSAYDYDWHGKELIA